MNSNTLKRISKRSRRPTKRTPTSTRRQFMPPERKWTADFLLVFLRVMDKSIDSSTCDERPIRDTNESFQGLSGPVSREKKGLRKIKWARRSAEQDTHTQSVQSISKSTCTAPPRTRRSRTISILTSLPPSPFLTLLQNFPSPPSFKTQHSEHVAINQRYREYK